MQITLDLPDDLAARLNTVQDKIPQILEFGLRKLESQPTTMFSELEDVLEFLAGLPTPEETLALRASDTLQTQINELLEKSKAVGLSPAEEKLWQSYEYAEHLVRIAKAKAYLRLKTTQ